MIALRTSSGGSGRLGAATGSTLLNLLRIGHTGFVVVALILAAGAGTRFTGRTHKLLADLRGQPVVRHAVGSAVASGLPVIVVEGAVPLRSLLDEAFGAAVETVSNPDWADGQATSAHVGFAVAEAHGHDAVVVGLGDQPFIAPESWRAVAEATGDIVVATYDGARGHPVRLGRSVWPLVPRSGEAVGREVFLARPTDVREIACSGSPIDIDTTEELSRWS